MGSARLAPFIIVLALMALQPALAAVRTVDEAPDGSPAAAADDGPPVAGAADADRSGVAGRFAAFPTLWQYYEALFPSAQLRPTILQWRGHTAWHEVLYQVPQRPRGTVFFAHGCSHAAHDFWPPSDACPHCLGLPEEVAQAQQALARGYAVLVMSANNTRGDQCMDWTSNHRDAVDVITELREREGLEALPLYGVGVSVGGGFLLKLPQFIKMDGVLSEVLGPRPDTFKPATFKFGMPPAVFIAMDMDPAMALRISLDAAKLRALGAPVQTVRVAQKRVGPAFFSDRTAAVSPAVSAKVAAALRAIGLVDGAGYVTADPRKVAKSGAWPWVGQLLERVPELRGGMTADHSFVWEELNLAYANHEIIGDFTTAALAWFESGGKADFGALLRRLAVPGSGILDDPINSIPAGWVPPADLAAFAGALRRPSGAAVAGQPAVPAPDAHPYAAHEAVVEAAHEAVEAGIVRGADDEAAAADAAGAAAAAAHVAAVQQAAAAGQAQQSQQQQAQQQQEHAAAGGAANPLQLNGAAAAAAQGRQQGRVAAASLDARPAAPAVTLATPAAGPAADMHSAQRLPAVGTVFAIMGGACGGIAMVALAAVLYRARQRCLGFARLPTREPLQQQQRRGGRAARLAPIPEASASLDSSSSGGGGGGGGSSSEDSELGLGDEESQTQLAEPQPAGGQRP